MSEPFLALGELQVEAVPGHLPPIICDTTEERKSEDSLVHHEGEKRMVTE
jgi:hypothetical protein